MKHSLISCFLLFTAVTLLTQPSVAQPVPAGFEEAYTLIEDMLLHPEKMDFKEVVFAVDNQSPTRPLELPLRPTSPTGYGCWYSYRICYQCSSCHA